MTTIEINARLSELMPAINGLIDGLVEQGESEIDFEFVTMEGNQVKFYEQPVEH